MAKGQTPHAKMKDLLKRLVRVPKSEIDSEDACEQADAMIFGPKKNKLGEVVVQMNKRKTGA